MVIPIQENLKETLKNRDAAMLQLLRAPLKDALRSANSMRLANRPQPKNGARNNTSLREEGARISEKFGRQMKKQV